MQTGLILFQILKLELHTSLFVWQLILQDLGELISVYYFCTWVYFAKERADCNLIKFSLTCQK